MRLAVTPSVQWGDDRLPGRFWSKCMPEPNSGCWLWFGASDKHGYGYYSVKRGAMRASHRYSYLTLVGSIPTDRELDHRVCEQPCCCNPAHLEPVTHAENIRRGRGPEGQRARFASQTHCKHGHPFDEQNTYLAPGREHRHRMCKECGRIRVRARRARQR